VSFQLSVTLQKEGKQKRLFIFFHCLLNGKDLGKGWEEWRFKDAVPHFFFLNGPYVPADPCDVSARREIVRIAANALFGTPSNDSPALSYRNFIQLCF